MGPRSDERGNPIRTVLVTSSNALQWGRACQRRLKIDPPELKAAESKLTHPGDSDQGEHEGEFSPSSSV